MMSFNAFGVFLTVFMISSASFANEVLSYVGTPYLDSKFNVFMSKNIGKIVNLDIVVQYPDDITYGYKGVQSTFDAKSTKGVSYSYFLDCDTINPDAETTIGKCGTLLNWNDSTKKLSGYFKVSKIEKTGLKNYRAVFLVPVRK